MAASAVTLLTSPRCWAWRFWSPIPLRPSSEPGIQHVPLDDLLARSDYVVCLAVANEQTENLIGQAALARMQPHAFFINLSRGNLVDEAALSAALRENRIAGAAMDVGRALDQMPSPELAKLPNVIATPAYRRPDAAGDREPVAGNGAAGGGYYCGRGSGRRGQCRALDAAEALRLRLRSSLYPRPEFRALPVANNNRFLVVVRVRLAARADYVVCLAVATEEPKIRSRHAVVRCGERHEPALLNRALAKVRKELRFVDRLGDRNFGRSFRIMLHNVHVDQPGSRQRAFHFRSGLTVDR